MNYFVTESGHSTQKRKAQEAGLDDLETEMAKLGRESQAKSSQNEYKYILSSDAIQSFLNPSTQMSGDDNELIKAIQKAILEEKNCPEILPFHSELYRNLSDIVLNQVWKLYLF